MALRALIAAIPHVGGSIDASVAGRPVAMTRAAECRLLFMFAELHREMRVLDAPAIQTDVLDTKEWADLVRRAVVRATQTRDCKTLSAIARMLAGAATGTAQWPGHAEDPMPAQREAGHELLAVLV